MVQMSLTIKSINSSQYYTKQGRRHRVAEEAYGYPIFCVAKIKRGNKRKKERVSKQKLLKGYHQGETGTVLVILTVIFWGV